MFLPYSVPANQILYFHIYVYLNKKVINEKYLKFYFIPLNKIDFNIIIETITNSICYNEHHHVFHHLLVLFVIQIC